MDTKLTAGQNAPRFALHDIQGGLYRLEDNIGSLVVLNFWSAECPWSKRSDSDVLDFLAGIQTHVVFWSIASNANEPVSLLQQEASKRSLPVVLLDKDQVVADLYGAVTTPHFFVVDQRSILRYQGAPNNANFRQPQPTRNYLREAVTAVLAGQEPNLVKTSPYGCAIVRFAPN